MAELEGFLCPLCKKDCFSVGELEAHYREAHDESSAAKLKRDFLSFFDKAVNTFVPDSPEQTRASSGEENVKLKPVTNVSGINTDYWDPQEFGQEVDYIAQFRRARDAHFSEIIVDTNRVINRLEKLFRLMKEVTPKTAKQIKSVEQNVVPWRKDEDEKFCRSCKQGFGIRRRRHHCRLCGGIMCKQCSLFMTTTDTYPLLSCCPDFESLAPSPAVVHKKKKLQFKLQDEEEGDEIRMCPDCKQIVDRKLLHLGPIEKPEIGILYDKMQHAIAQSEELKPDFLTLVQTVWAGEPGPTLQEGSQQRQELMRVYESIDTFSKRILGLGGASPSPQFKKLTRNVRVATSNYLQEHLLTLPALPTKAQLQEIKERKEREAQERLQELERQREEQKRINARKAAETSGEKNFLRSFSSKTDGPEEKNFLKSLSIGGKAEKKATEEKSGLEMISDEMDRFATDFDKFSSEVEKVFGLDKLKDWISTGPKKTSEPVAMKEVKEAEGEKGWMCDTNQVMTSLDQEEADPFVIQKEQLLSYIAQAREANRMDEVQALEESLIEIEMAMQDRHKSYGFS